MNSFDESVHPREGDGKFATKARSEASVTLNADGTGGRSAADGILSRLPDPDLVGQSEYRAVYDYLTDYVASGVAGSVDPADDTGLADDMSAMEFSGSLGYLIETAQTLQRDIDNGRYNSTPPTETLDQALTDTKHPIWRHSDLPNAVPVGNLEEAGRLGRDLTTWTSPNDNNDITYIVREDSTGNIKVLARDNNDGIIGIPKRFTFLTTYDDGDEHENKVVVVIPFDAIDDLDQARNGQVSERLEERLFRHSGSGRTDRAEAWYEAHDEDGTMIWEAGG